MVVGSLTLGVLSSITEFEPMLSGYALLPGKQTDVSGSGGGAWWLCALYLPGR